MDEHNRYVNELGTTYTWLEHLEQELAQLITTRQQPSATPTQEERTTRAASLSKIVIERDRGQHRVTNSAALGERLLPDTSSSGRERIRNELRDLRDRYVFI